MRIGLMVGSDKERSRADRMTGVLDDGKAAEPRDSRPSGSPRCLADSMR
jgi:hypothetical protein